MVSRRAAAALVAELLLAQGRPADLAQPGLIRDASSRRPRGWTLGALSRGVGESPWIARRVFPAFEDAWYYLWRERRCRSTSIPFDARLDDPAGTRAHPPRVFEPGLPNRRLRAADVRQRRRRRRWQTGPWFLRAERCT